MQNIKVVVVADAAVPIAEFWLSLQHSPQRNDDGGPDDSVLCVLVEENGKIYNLGVWRTAGGPEYDRLRPLSYPRTDVFAIAYDPTSAITLENIKSKWVPEIQEHAPSTPFAIISLRGSESEGKPVEVDDAAGEKFAKALNAMGFFSMDAKDASESFAKFLLEHLLKEWDRKKVENNRTKFKNRCTIS